MENKSISLKDIEDFICKWDNEHPECNSRLVWHKTNMRNSEGEPLFLVDLGKSMYIGGTKAQLEERINRFYKHLINSL